MRAGQVRSGLVVLVLAGTAMLMPTECAHARQPMVVTGAPRISGAGLAPMMAMGGRAGPPVTKAQLDRYADVLGLTDEQRASATSMLEAMQADYVKASGEMRQQLEATQAEFQESRDTSVFTKKMPALVKEMQRKRAEMETTFFDDLRLTLSADQEEKWPRFERVRRRELSANQSVLSGEGIDLTRIIAELKAPAEVTQPLDTVLEQYEVDIDRAIVERNKVNDARNEKLSGGPQGIDPSVMTQVMKESKDAGKKICGVNKQYARQIASTLPEEWATKFNTALREAWWPQVYGRGHMTRTFETATGLEDLTPEQLAAINELRESYQREVASFNDKWAAALEADEMSDSAGTFMLGGGAVMRLKMSDGTEPESPLDKARDARTAVDDRFAEKVRSTLNESQRAKLPKRGDPDPGAETAQLGWRVEMSSHDDGVNPPVENIRVTSPDGQTSEAGTPPTPPVPPAPPPRPASGG